MKFAAILLLVLVFSYVLYLCNLFLIAAGRGKSKFAQSRNGTNKNLRSLLTTDNMDCEFVMI